MGFCVSFWFRAKSRAFRPPVVSTCARQRIQCSVCPSFCDECSINCPEMKDALGGTDKHQFWQDER